MLGKLVGFYCRYFSKFRFEKLNFVGSEGRGGVNRPFPNCCQPHYESEARCKAFHMKISFVCKGIMRLKTSRKWPCAYLLIPVQLFPVYRGGQWQIYVSNAL